MVHRRHPSFSPKLRRRSPGAKEPRPPSVFLGKVPSEILLVAFSFLDVRDRFTPHIQPSHVTLIIRASQVHIGPAGVKGVAADAQSAFTRGRTRSPSDGSAVYVGAYEREYPSHPRPPAPLREPCCAAVCTQHRLAASLMIPCQTKDSRVLLNTSHDADSAVIAELLESLNGLQMSRLQAVTIHDTTAHTHGVLGIFGRALRKMEVTGPLHVTCLG